MASVISRVAIPIRLLICSLLLVAEPVHAIKLRVVTHFHSTYSHDGHETLEAIAGKVHEKRIDVFIPTDTLIATAEYGVWPLRNLIKKTIARPSILFYGASRYLRDIEALQMKFPDMVIIPGAEAAAYYRWEGKPWSRLILNDWSRHLLLLGLRNAEDFRFIPIIGNPPGGRLDWFLLWPVWLLVLAVPLWFLRRKVATLLAVIVAMLFLYNNYPFCDIDYDAYESETVWGPYQQLIDYARQKGALAVWAHPDAPNFNDAKEVSPRVSVRTPAYPEALLRTTGYNGFGVFMEGLRQSAVPGGTWDDYLNLYSKGERKEPVWGFAEIDYHGNNPSVFVDSAEMIVEAKAKSESDVIQAMREGQFYSIRTDGKSPMVPSEWRLKAGSAFAERAGTLAGTCRPTVVLKLEYADGSTHIARVRIIRDGHVILEDKKALPNRWEFTDSKNSSSRSSYRVLVDDDQLTWLATNPIFCSERL